MITGGKNMSGANEAPIQFGFTTTAMKTTLFSRMSPQAKSGSVINFNEASKNIRSTQGSTNNIVTSNAAGPYANSPSAGAARTNSNPTS